MGCFTVLKGKKKKSTKTNVEDKFELMLKANSNPPWTLQIRAQVKDLSFKFKSLLPICCKLFPFTIQIKLPQYHLEIESKSEPIYLHKTKSFKSKILKIFKIFQIKRARNKGNVRISYAPKNYWNWRRTLCAILLWVLLCFVIVQLNGYFSRRSFLKYIFYKTLRFWI